MTLSNTSRPWAGLGGAGSLDRLRRVSGGLASRRGVGCRCHRVKTRNAAGRAGPAGGPDRYALIQELIDTKLTSRERGRLARELASREDTDPIGRQVRIARGTLDGWTRQYRKGGFPALVPAERQVTPRTPIEVLDLAAALKRENPARTAAQVQRTLCTTRGWSPTDRPHAAAALRERRADRHRRERTAGGVRPLRSCPGQRVVDRRRSHGPKIGGRKTYL